MKFSVPLLTTLFCAFANLIQAGQVSGTGGPATDPKVLAEALKAGTGAGVEEFNFETQVNKVMDIIIHSLYKTKGKY